MTLLVLMEIHDVGGPARNLLDTLELLRDRVRFVFGVYRRGRAGPSPFEDELARRGVETVVLRERFRYDPGVVGQLRRLLRELRPDGVQVHNTKSRLFLLGLRGLRADGGVCQLHAFHGETWVDARQQVYNRLDRLLFRRAPAILLVAERQRELLTSWGVPGERMTVVHNAIALKETRATPPGDPLQLLYVGRMTREKGHARLLRAVREVVRSCPPAFVLRLVGDGPEREALRAFARAEGLDPWVRWEGTQSDPTPYYEAADLFVLPSYTEGLPNVLLEAGLYRVPVLAFGVGGVPEVFGEQEAVILDPDDEPGLVRGIQSFLRDPAAWAPRAEAARKRIEQQFSQTAKAEKLYRLWTSLTGTGAPPEGGGA